MLEITLQAIQRVERLSEGTLSDEEIGCMMGTNVEQVRFLREKGRENKEKERKKISEGVKKALQNLPERICATCQKTYKPTANNQQYCEESCRPSYKGPKTVETEEELSLFLLPIKNCLTCQKEFQPECADQDYCDSDCWHHRKELEQKQADFISNIRLSDANPPVGQSVDIGDIVYRKPRTGELEEDNKAVEKTEPPFPKRNCVICQKEFQPKTDFHTCCGSDCRTDKEVTEPAEPEKDLRIIEKEEPLLPLKTCPTCGKDFPYSSKGRIYCHRRCYPSYGSSQAREIPSPDKIADKKISRDKKTCPTCQKEFEPDSNNQRYCRVECRDSYPDSKKVEPETVESVEDKPNHIKRTCRTCQKEFLGSSRRRYCNPLCWPSHAAKELTIRTCLRCGKQIDPQVSKYLKYCGKACKQEARNVQGRAYRARLKNASPAPAENG